jgi:hypothetical protein
MLTNLNVFKFDSYHIWKQGLQIFQKSGTHLEILGARKGIWVKSRPEDSQF